LLGGDSREGKKSEEKGFWENLESFFFPEDDREIYGEGLRRGGYLVTVTGLDPAILDQALDILDAEGTVDLEQRSETWRSEGWTGVQDSSPAQLVTPAASSAGSEPYQQSGTVGENREDDTDDEVIPIVEERLRVGKRDTNLGRVRVRSYVVEEPVEEQVTLRQERVKVERRPVDQALSGRETVFQDRVIEAEERAEEAVVSKEARVTEEVALRKEAEQRTEKISDTVRHTEVEVEDERGNRDSLTEQRNK